MITDNEARECIKKLGDYCLEHNRCEGCIFKPKDYKPVTNECIMQYNPPCDVIVELKKKEIKNE